MTNNQKLQTTNMDPVRSHPAKGTATTTLGRSASNGMEQILESLLFTYGESISLKTSRSYKNIA